MGYQNHGLTPQDCDFLAAQEKHTQAFGDLIHKIHLEARTSNLLHQAETLKAKLMEHGQGEAANAIEFACAAIEDAKDELAK